MKTVTLDLETDGFDFITPKIVLVGYKIDNNPTKYTTDIADLRQYLESKEYIKIAHNLKFEFEMLREAGIAMSPPFFDTQIAAFILQSGYKMYVDGKVNYGYSQKGLEEVFCGEVTKNRQALATSLGIKSILNFKALEKYYKKKLKIKRNPLSSEMPIDVLSKYCMLDVEGCYELFKNFAPTLKDRGLAQLFMMEMRLIPVLADIEKEGVLLDSDYLLELRTKLVEQRENIIKKMDIYRKPEQTDKIWSSPKQLNQLLFSQLGLPKTKKIKTGMSTASPELKKIKNSHPIISMLLEYRVLNKIITTYTKTWVALINKKTGRLHPNASQTSAETGRLTFSHPGTNQIPIRGDRAKMLRRAFIAPKGYVIIEGDYSQIDLRVLAHESGDIDYIEAFNRGEDPHKGTASISFNIPLDRVTDEDRNNAKEINFAVVYGVSAKSLAEKLKVSIQEAQGFIKLYFARRPGVANWLTCQPFKVFNNRGYCKTFLGRERYLEHIFSDQGYLKGFANRQSVNTPCQGGAGEIIKLALLKCYNELVKIEPKCKMFLTVYDSIYFYTPEGTEKKLIPIVRDIMENVYKLKVPLVVKMKKGKNLGEMVPV